jgi:hypothetical protein
MEARCLDEPTDVGETSEIGVIVIFELKSDRERAFGGTGPHAVRCNIASVRARRQYLLGGFPIIFHLYIRVAYIFLYRQIPDFCISLAGRPNPLHLQKKGRHCGARPCFRTAWSLLGERTAGNPQQGKKSDGHFQRAVAWHAASFLHARPWLRGNRVLIYSNHSRAGKQREPLWDRINLTASKGEDL